MAKKVSFDDTVKKVEKAANTVNIIMRNRLIIAIFLIVDGITFLQNPETTLPGMAKNIILLALLATFSVFITNLAAKVKDIKTIVISAIILVVGGVLYFYPDFVAAYIQLALALLVIFDGVKNIASELHLGRLTNYTKTIAGKYNQLASRKTKNKKEQAQREKFKEVDDSLDNELEGQKNKLLGPLQTIVGKTSKSLVLYVITTAVTIALGIVLLVSPDVSMAVWGLIFLYTGAVNLVASLRSMNIIKKLKEKKFKGIIFDAEKDAKKDKEKDKEKEKEKAPAKQSEKTNNNKTEDK